MIIKTTLLWLVSICFSFSLLAQGKKMEREKRIRKEEIPAVALTLLNNPLGKARKVKYFLGTDGDNKSFEIKFLLHRNQYSVEFDSEGRLEDVEVLISFGKLNKDIRKNVTDHLGQYDNFKVKKTQKQFSSQSQTAEEVIKMALEDLPAETVRYEMIVETKAGSTWTTYEMLLDDQGNFISQKEVIGRLEDNILY